MKVKQLSQDNYINAIAWYYKHKEYISNLLDDVNASYPPTDSLDINCPDLWKPAHWNWFLQEHIDYVN